MKTKKIRVTKRDVNAVKEMADRARELHDVIGSAYHNKRLFGFADESMETEADLNQIQKCSDHLYAKFCR